MSQQRHYRLVQQRSTPISFGRTKFTHQLEETVQRHTKPTLQRGLGFGETTSSGEVNSGTRDSSFGKKWICFCV